MLGSLYLLPTPLGEDTLHVLPPYLIEIAHTLDTFIVERAKTARHFLKAIAIPTPLQELTMHELNEHTQASDIKNYLDAALQGKNVGLMSEAGCPGVADPGAVVVAMAHQQGITVVPIVGPSSILLALMASGMNGQGFGFVGYLPAKPLERVKAIKQLEGAAIKTQHTQIFIETPYRNGVMLQDLLLQLNPHTRLCIAINITTPTESIFTQTVAAWRKEKNLDKWTTKAPAIFLISAT
jgi:16S rRNA (cytidine1402-2'-O)-methyltransferase